MTDTPSAAAQHIFNWCRNSQEHDVQLRQIALRQYMRVNTGTFQACTCLAYSVYSAMWRAREVAQDEYTARDLLQAALLFHDYVPEGL